MDKLFLKIIFLFWFCKNIVVDPLNWGQDGIFIDFFFFFFSACFIHPRTAAQEEGRAFGLQMGRDTAGLLRKTRTEEKQRKRSGDSKSFFLINIKSIFRNKNRARHRVENAWAEIRDPQYLFYILVFSYIYSTMEIWSLVSTFSIF